MKKLLIISVALLTFALTSCEGMGEVTNSYDCTTRYDVQLVDGSAMWVYGGSVNDGYVKGNDEAGNDVWVSMHQVITVTKVDCGNGN
jgi:hypothetical protein